MLYGYMRVNREFQDLRGARSGLRTYFLYSLLITALLLIPLCKSARCYPVSRTGELKLFEQLVRTSTVDTQRPVVLYDNLRYRHGGEEDSPVLEKGCRCLIPADIINVNLNMTCLFHSPVKPAEDMLGELIYANIELKKMLEKYESIQKRAVKIAEASGSPAFIDSPYSIYMPLPDLMIQGFEIEKAKQKHNVPESEVSSRSRVDKPLSLSKDVKKLENSINRVLTRALPVTVSSSPSNAAEQTAVEKVEGAIDMPRPVIIRNSAPEKFVNMASRSLTVSGLSAGTAGRTAHYSGTQGSSEATKPEQDRTLRDINPGELPWWIKAPSEFITYCMNNKIEAGIMLLVFIFFMNIIGGIFRR